MSEQKIRFDGQVAVVTGAGGGLGKAYALELAGRGAKVVVNDLGVAPSGEPGVGAKSADTVVAEIIQAGGEAIASYDNVLEGDKIVEAAMDHFGGLDILINNAGYTHAAPFHLLDDKDWHGIIDVHINGTYKTTRSAWPHLMQRGYGRVLLTASPGIHGGNGASHYCSAKASMIGFAKALTVEAQANGAGINTNVIVPSAKTRMTVANQIPSEAYRGADPKFVAPIVALLCHQSNSNSGCIFEAGGRSFYQVKLAFGEGITLDEKDCNAESLLENWSTLESFENPEFIDDVVEIVRRLGIDLTYLPTERQFPDEID